MNYLEAKTVLMRNNPQMPFHLIAIEVVALVCLAAILVKIFA